MEGWTTILTFTYPHEAYMAKARLESEGIEAVIFDDLVSQINNFYSNAIGGVKLLVRAEQAQAAYKILVDGGYIVETPPRESKFLNSMDAKTASIPLFKYLPVGLRLTVITLTIIAFFVTVGVFAFQPNDSEKLKKGYWCVDKMIIDGQEYTFGNDTSLGMIRCAELMYFGPLNQGNFPGFNKANIHPRWTLENGNLIITKVEFPEEKPDGKAVKDTASFDSFFDIVQSEEEIVERPMELLPDSTYLKVIGSYEVDFSGNRLFLKSERVTIFAHLE